MPEDLTSTDPSLYKVVFENDRVRVLEYRDRPGDRTHPHGHPDSVMVTLGEVRWVGAKTHAGENIGASETHAIFVELKEPPPAGAPSGDPPLVPTA